ncbi:MAG: hypothetical protein CL938_06370 [Deltaproteobacteria bacterium]|nr:hypothetical protein [Deltaproteobacteria bacterium]
MPVRLIHQKASGRWLRASRSLSIHWTTKRELQSAWPAPPVTSHGSVLPWSGRRVASPSVASRAQAARAVSVTASGRSALPGLWKIQRLRM